MKNIPNFENYQIDEDGNIYGKKDGRKLRFTTYRGAHYVRLYDNGCPFRLRVARLVALTFIPNPNNYSMVVHINRDKLDNRVENLAWTSNPYEIIKPKI